MMLLFMLLLAAPQVTAQEKPMIVAGVYQYTRQVPSFYNTTKWGSGKYGFEPRLTVIKGQAAINRLRALLGEPTILPAGFGVPDQHVYLFARSDHPKLVGMMVVVSRIPR